MGDKIKIAILPFIMVGNSVLNSIVIDKETDNVIILDIDGEYTNDINCINHYLTCNLDVSISDASKWIYLGMFKDGTYDGTDDYTLYQTYAINLTDLFTILPNRYSLMYAQDVTNTDDVFKIATCARLLQHLLTLDTK